MASYGKGSFDGFTPYQGDSRTGNRGSSGGSDFEKISKDITTNIENITKNVSQIQRLVSQIGTGQDSDELRQRVHQATHYTNQLAKETGANLKKLAYLPAPSDQRQWKVQKERLTDAFSSALQNFQTIQRTAAEKERASMQRARAHSGIEKSPFDDFVSPQKQDEEMAAPGFSQTRQVLQMEQDVDLEMMREREDAIKRLESDITDVNQIFKDLGMLVHEQGEVLDSIEANITTAEMSVGEGVKQLSKARDYQAKSRRKCCILFFIILVILIIIGLIIYLAVKG